MKAISNGIVFTDLHRILLCKVTGKGFWDIPKGGANEYEAPVTAAIRECKEETGIEIDVKDVIPFGKRYYNRWKDINVFISCLDELPCVDNMQCTSYFGKDNLPEVDEFRYIHLHDIDLYTNRNLFPLLNNVILDLQEIKRNGKDTDIGDVDVFTARLLQSRWMR